MQTAQPLANVLDLEVVPDRDLRERHYGVFQKLTYAELRTRYPEDFASFEARDPEFSFRNGESLRDFALRSVSVIRRIANAHRDESVLVFTHGGVLDELYRHVRGIPVSAAREFGIPNCGINRFVHEGGAWRIESWADVAHLEGALDDL